MDSTEKRILAYLTDSGAGAEREKARPDRVPTRARRPSRTRKPRLSAGRTFPVEVRNIYDEEEKKFANVPKAVFDEAYDLVDGDLSRLRVSADGQSIIIR